MKIGKKRKETEGEDTIKWEELVDDTDDKKDIVLQRSTSNDSISTIVLEI